MSVVVICNKVFCSMLWEVVIMSRIIRGTILTQLCMLIMMIYASASSASISKNVIGVWNTVSATSGNESVNLEEKGVSIKLQINSDNSIVYILSYPDVEARMQGTWSVKDDIVTMNGQYFSESTFRYDESLDALKCHIEVSGQKVDLVLKRAIEGPATEAFSNIAALDISSADQEMVLAVKENISALSDDELSILACYINQEVVNRKIEKTAHLEAGWYAIGDDIPSGKYIYQIEEGQFAGAYVIAKKMILASWTNLILSIMLSL